MRPVNTTTDENRDLVLDHIKSFPTVESHYCRKNSKKLYLSSDLNLSLMYRLYKEMCVEKNRAHVSEYVYRKLFNELSPQRSFFIPKKDQCFLCNSYHSKPVEERIEPIKEKWEQHKRREMEALDSKAKDNLPRMTEVRHLGQFHLISKLYSLYHFQMKKSNILQTEIKRL